MKIHVSPDPIQLAVDFDEANDLRLWYQGTPLSAHGDRLVISYSGSALPVSVEILDFDDASRWAISAVHGSNTWTREAESCRFSWSDTNGEIEVQVTATNPATEAKKTKPILITVQPEGARPDFF